VCGIFGCLSDGASGAILEGLKRLEYRGYDSVGIAVIKGNKVVVEKAKGRITDFIANIDDSAIQSDIGIGHTRWATHGAPCKENAHPHVDCTGSIAVVHNGVLENFMQLRDTLKSKGHRFNSNTDTEIIPHLIEEGMKEGLPLKDSIIQAAKSIKGSMACVVISSHEPDKIFCVRRESPLVVGISTSGSYCASDIPALLPFTRNVMVMKDETLAILKKGGIEMVELDGNELKPTFSKISWDLKMAEKGGFPHFMIKEIHEQPNAIKETLKVPLDFLDKAAALLEGRIYLTGSGTSYHACLSASYQMTGGLGLDARPVISSELVDTLSDMDGSTVIAVSQSGETADTLNAIRYAKGKGAKVLGVTNTLGSSLTLLSDAYICTQSGPEIGVAATKTFLTQLAALDLLLLRLRLRKGGISGKEYSEEKRRLDELPKILAEVIKKEDDVRRFALKYLNCRDAFFLARGINVATALEGALKLKEISYIHAEGYPAGESKHGPISLIEPGFLCVFIAPKDGTRGRVIGNVMEMKARGGSIMSIITAGDEEMMEVSDSYFEVPEVPAYLYPIVTTVPLQLFAYHTATLKGLDPDKPRNLAKSVTVM
jgi:glucosamine--fructose-6-phosphate aminotransferase (isomerizing)